jgi:hypothetical protein
LQLRWRPLAAAEAGAAASGAAGMPVRWPRRPAAVSEAVAAGAGPDFSCAGELEQPLKALIGEVRSLSVVCVCVSGSVGRVWSCGRSSFVFVVWGGSPASGWRVSSIFPAKEKNLCRRFFRVRLPIWGPVRVPVGMPPPSSIPSFVMFHCLRRRRPGSRATCIRWWRVRTLLVDHTREPAINAS